MEYDGRAIISLVEQYEEKLRLKQPCYFDIDDFELIIDHYLFDQEITEAAEAVDVASYYYPNSFEIKLKRAEVEVERDNAANALKLLADIEPLAFNHTIDVQTLRIRALLGLGNLRDALAILDKLFESIDIEPDLDLQQAVAELIESAEYQHALRYLEILLPSDSENKTLLLDAAYCYEKLDNPTKAAEYYERYLDEDPFNYSVWYELGRMYEISRRYEKAVDAFDFSITLNDKYLMALIGKASALTGLEMYEEAITALEEILTSDPNNLATSYAIAECNEKLGNYTDAMRIYLSIIERDGSFGDAHYGVALIMEEQGRLEESLTFFQKAVELAPDSTEYLWGLGKLLMRLQLNEKAIGVFRKAVTIDSNDTELWLALYELEAARNPQKGLECLEEAATYAYNAPEICYRLAALYYYENDMDRCAELLERGVNANVEMSGVFFNLCPEAYHEEQLMTIYLNSKSKQTL